MTDTAPTKRQADPFERIFELLIQAVHPREWPRLRRMKTMLRREIAEIWAFGRSNFTPKDDECDRLFDEAVDAMDRESRTPGRPSPQSKMATTLVLHLADLYVAAVRPSYGIKTLSDADRSRFGKFLAAGVAPLENDYLTENILTIWRRNKKKMFPVSALQKSNLPSHANPRIRKTARGHLGIAACSKRPLRPT